MPDTHHAITLYPCAAGFSWIDYEDAIDGLEYQRTGECMVGEELFECPARRMVDFQAAWVGF